MNNREAIPEAANEKLQGSIRALASKWRKKLTSLDRRNPTLYFKTLKVGTLALPPLDAEAMRTLVDESKTLDLTQACASDPDALKRLSAIRAKALENEEERGIQTMFVALGTATWKATDGGRDPLAPLFFLPVLVTEPAKRPHITRNGDLLLNRVMLQVWEQEHELKPDDLSEDAIEMPILDAFAQIKHAGRHLAGFSTSKECHLSNFSFAKMAMCRRSATSRESSC